jgi:hypothetical protein
MFLEYWANDATNPAFDNIIQQASAALGAT